MIRYFGFFVNRVVAEKLSEVRGALGVERHSTSTSPLRYGEMIKIFLKLDPFECVFVQITNVRSSIQLKSRQQSQTQQAS